jgi:hypothetical protein
MTATDRHLGRNRAQTPVTGGFRGHVPVEVPPPSGLDERPRDQGGGPRLTATLHGDLHTRPKGTAVFVLGIILLLLDMLLLGTGILSTIGWILIVVGLILLLLGAVDRSVGPRRYYW